MHVVWHSCSTSAEAKDLLRVMAPLLVSSCQAPMAGIGLRIGVTMNFIFYTIRFKDRIELGSGLICIHF
jgi:hypothetical protein